MKRSLKNLLIFKIKETDGEKGNIKDFLFDAKKWIIRYLEVEIGSFFMGKRVLVERSFLDSPHWDTMTFPIKLTKLQIENAPELKDHLPVSAQYEIEFNKHYNINTYMDMAYSGFETTFPPRPIRVPSSEFCEEDIETNLRSFNEVNNYHVRAKDGMIGHICDLIIDDEDWQIVYAIIDTSNWMLWSKKVIVPIKDLEQICYLKNEITTSLDIETIKNSPEYHETKISKSDYEKSLYDFYTKTL